MNGAQQAVFAWGLTIAVLMGLWPPWLERDFRKPELAQPAGYSSLFSPPTDAEGRMHWVTVDLKRLGVQEGIVIVATAGLMVLLKGRGKTERKKLLRELLAEEISAKQKG